MSDFFPQRTVDELHTGADCYKDEHHWRHGGAAIQDLGIVSGIHKYPLRIERSATTDGYFRLQFEKGFESIVPGFLVRTLERFLRKQLFPCKRWGRRATASIRRNSRTQFHIPTLLNMVD